MTRADELRSLPGIRVIAQIGPDRLLRLGALSFVLVFGVVVARDYGALLDPTTIGGDVSNYYAAGQRLDAGRPVPRRRCRNP